MSFRDTVRVRDASFAAPPHVVATVLLCVFLLQGCVDAGSGESVDGDPRVIALRDSATSDFEREVFADGVITDQEYQASRVLLAECMEELGYNVTLKDGPGAMDVESLTAEAAATVDGSMITCGEGATALIEETYVDILGNPDNEDLLQLKADCLVRNEIFPAGYSRDDFANAVGFLEDVASSVAFNGCMRDPKGYVATDADLTTPFS